MVVKLDWITLHFLSYYYVCVPSSTYYSTPPHITGVLLPPAFGVTGTPSQKGTGPPMSVQHRLLRTASHQNRPIDYVDYLHETDLSSCILKDHMEPGIWVAAQAATNTMIRLGVRPLLPSNGDSSCHDEASTTTSTSATTRSPTSFMSSQLFLEKKLAFSSTNRSAIKGVVQFRTETDPGSDPTLSGSVQLTKYSSLFASISSGGVGGWLGAHYDRSFHIHESLPSPVTNILLNDIYANDPFQTAAQVKPYDGLDTMSRSTINCKLGSWMPISWCGNPLNLISRMTETNSRASDDDDSSSTQRLNDQQLHGYAAVNMLGATAAVHASMDGSFQRLPVWRSYFSANLNDVDRPPLQITLEHLHSSDHTVGSSSILCLSQVLAFDRWQLNPMEDRSPKVRNTVAWTVRVENCDASASSWEDRRAHDDESTPPRQNRMSLGAAWQINRGLAVKAVLEEHGVLTGAVLLKRWKQPRLTCSLLGSFDRTRGLKFLGVGLELETGNLETNPEAYYYNHHPSQATMVVDDDGSCVPQTRATLPSDLKG